MSDRITILTTMSQRLNLAKTWRAGGVLRDYDLAKNFYQRFEVVEDIDQLSGLLTKLETEPRSCVVRGHYNGQDRVTARKVEHFDDNKLHSVLLDVDGYHPPEIDPLTNPEAAISHLVEHDLPEEFRFATYHWQLSNSFCHPTKLSSGLRVHLWFWLNEALTGSQLNAWASRVNKVTAGVKLDRAVFRRVQILYTAAPIVEMGVECPVKKRSGLVRGLTDEVFLTLTDDDRAAIAESATALDRPRTLEDVDDPVVGWLFDNWEVFGQDMDGKVHVRCPFPHDSGGQGETSSTYMPSGMGREDAGYSCLHASCQGKHNLFDFLRAVGYDKPDTDFEVVVATDPKRELRDGLMATFLKEIEETEYVVDLEEKVGRRIAGNLELTATERAMLVTKIKARAKTLGTTVPIGDVRNWVAPRALAGGFPDISPESGMLLTTLENFRHLMKSLGIVLRYNTIRKDIDILIPGVSLSQDNKDNAARAYVISECERAGLSPKHVDSYLLAVADENPYNPVLTWITSKPWDGKSRLQDLYDTVYSQAPHKEMVMRKWLISAVAAAVSPDGISAQGVLTFQGAQNKGKSTWFKRLVPMGADFFKGEYALKVQDKDSVFTAMGYWIVELGELDATFSKSEISNLKNFITNSADKLRRPYAARDSYLPRRTVLCATVNPPEFLRDPTGNRRFWCIPVDGFKYDHEINMQQLWAEVFELVKAGEYWGLNSEEMETVSRGNQQFVEVSPWGERLAVNYAWDTDRKHWRKLASVQVAAECGTPRPSTGDCREIVGALRKLSGEHVATHGGVNKWLVPQLIGSDFVD